MIIRDYQLLKATYFQALCVLIVCTFALFTNVVTTQSSKSVTDDDTEQFIRESDSIDNIQLLITDTFDQKKDTITGLHYCKTFLERGYQEGNLDMQYFLAFN